MSCFVSEVWLATHCEYCLVSMHRRLFANDAQSGAPVREVSSRIQRRAVIRFFFFLMAGQIAKFIVEWPYNMAVCVWSTRVFIHGSRSSQTAVRSWIASRRKTQTAAVCKQSVIDGILK